MLVSLSLLARTVDTSEFLGLIDSVLLSNQIQATNVRKDDVGLSTIEHLKKNHNVEHPIFTVG